MKIPIPALEHTVHIQNRRFSQKTSQYGYDLGRSCQSHSNSLQYM